MNRDGFRGENDPAGAVSPYVNQKGVQANDDGATGEPRPHGLYLDDGDVRLYHGDALTVLQGLEAESVHMCVTSPPFYGLRDYGTGRWEGGNPSCDHKPPPTRFSPTSTLKNDGRPNPGAKNYELQTPTPYRDRCGKCGARRVDQQIGLEETPEAWCESLVAVFHEVRRVLRPEGVLFVEVGDSYAANRTYQVSDNKHKAHEFGDSNALRVPPGYKPKDLIGAPWQLAFALRADGWYLRSDIIWARPNPMPESVTDRPTKSHSYVFLLAKRPRYYWDAEAVREASIARPGWGGPQRDTRETHGVGGGNTGLNAARAKATDDGGFNGRNVRSVWNIATQPYPEAHFATFPEELARRCILAGTSERGACPDCGAPWIRQLERDYVGERNTRAGSDGQQVHREGVSHDLYAIPAKTLGWRPSCDHDREPVGCTLIDPFVGSGTVPFVARKHGRHSIGIDLSGSYLELAARRLQQLSLFA